MPDTETAAPPKSPRREAPPLPRFAIELGDSANRKFFWHPNQSTYRGRWTWSNVPAFQMPSEDPIVKAPDMPGQIIVIDPTRKRIMVHDPLNDERNKGLLEVWQRLCLESNGVGGQRFGPETEYELQGTPTQPISDDLIKTWTYWARRFVDAQQCTTVMGKVPTMAEVLAMPGEIYGETSDPRRSGATRHRYRATDAAYQPPKVPAKTVGEASLLPAEFEE